MYINIQLTAECHELRSQLDHQTQLMETMRNQRDAAIASLNKHGISCDDITGHVMDIQTLQAQNEELREVIRQMRMELEQLSDSPIQRDHHVNQSMPTTNYVQYMEEEVRKVKSENRQLTEQLQQAAAQGKPPTPNTIHKKSPNQGEKRRGHSTPPSPSVDVHLKHQTHLIALSDTIASLQREKVDMENKTREWKTKVEQLQDKLKEEEELVIGCSELEHCRA